MESAAEKEMLNYCVCTVIILKSLMMGQGENCEM
jgi:hypothetical protein